MRIGFALFAAIFLAAGCGATIDVKGTLPAKQMKIAVLDFADVAAYKAQRDYTLSGTSGEEHPDILMARAVRKALSQCPEYQVMSWVDMRRALKRKNEVKPASDRDAMVMAKKLGVEAVVIGEIEKYKQSWTLAFGWASVAFTARCLEVPGGKELWSARVSDWRSGAIE